MIPHRVSGWFRLIRLIPAGTRGKARLARMILQRLLPDAPVEITAAGLRFQAPSAREPVAFHLIADGSYDGETAGVIARALKPDGVFFDVGANIGVLSLQAALKWCPAGRVVGFEASPTVKSYLETNAKLNGATNFTLMHRAVTAHSGDYLPFFEAPPSKFGMGSLANRFGTTEHRIPTITLDDAATELGISRVNVIKVDVEGFELGGVSRRDRPAAAVSRASDRV